MSAEQQTLAISIHALLAESDVHFDNFNLHCVISIHALLAESDLLLRLWQRLLRFISIHALLAESDITHPISPSCIGAFLSTLSLRRATPARSMQQKPPPYFYPRSPCGERRNVVDTPIRILGISIHALLAESDPRRVLKCDNRAIISIHALLAESDPLRLSPC